MLTTHYLEEADSQAERVVVIDHGEIIADDTAAHLKATLAGDRIIVTVDRRGVDAAARCWASWASELDQSGRPDGDRAVRGGSSRAPGRCPVLLRELDHAGVEVLAADVRVPTLDDVFLSLTGRSLREESEVAA